MPVGGWLTWDTFASGAALLTETANKGCVAASEADGPLDEVISIVGLKVTLFLSATACKSAALTESISVAATIFPFPSTMMVVGLDLIPYHAKTLPDVSTPTHPDIFFLVRNVWTVFGSSSSMEMN